MTTDKKTLADVQPGGRVRLGHHHGGEHAEPVWLERADAWMTLELEWAIDWMPADKQRLARAAFDAGAALAAQPSPAGQGDASTIEMRARELLATEWRKLSFDAPVKELRAGCELPPLVAAGVRAIVCALSASTLPDSQRSDGYLLPELRDVEEYLYHQGSCLIHTATVRAAINALAARQPVGQEPVACCKDGILFWHGDHTAHRGENYDLYAAPPAQAVDHDLHQHLLDMLGAKDHEDAGRIIGKLHAPAFDLGQFRQAVTVYASRMKEMADYSMRCGHSRDAVEGWEAREEEAKRLLALIDSQAVGNG